MNLIALHFLWFFTLAGGSSTIPCRELLSLMSLYREKTIFAFKETDSAFERLYIVQRIICLFGASNDSAQALLRGTILDRVMEEEGEVLRQGKAFSKLVSAKSELMISGLDGQENGGLDLSIELKVLFQGTTGLASVKQFMASTSQDHFSFSGSKIKSVRRWQMLAMSEAAMAWKQFNTHYEFAPYCNKLTKALNSKNPQCDIKERMDTYLNSYERFLKPTVHQLDLTKSYARLMSVYYFFQYLHQISRIYAAFLTSDHMNRLKCEHLKFIEDTDSFLSSIILQRTLISSLPFDGRWMFKTQFGDGIVVPSNLYSVKLVEQYKKHIMLTRVVLYHVGLNNSPGCVRFLIMEQGHLELTIFTTRTEWDEVWLRKLVNLLNRRLSSHDDISYMIYS